MGYSIVELNQLNQAAFIAALGAVFEDTPAIAEQAWTMKPFADLASLHRTMVAIVNAMPPTEQLALIQAHPDLGSRTKMAEASVQEQSGVGLDRLSPAEYQQFQTLNQTYTTQFGFPFIIAVKNHTKASILQAFAQRLQNDRDRELHQALYEIAQIAQFRLEALIDEDSN
jgi:2-oxo-4-hydroxy-4-carboxy-5-ureidoimidazoline decarboxylase